MKRAQITMESLLLYGAAILVVLLAIAALTYFGVFDLGNLLPQRCDMGDTGIFKCENWQLLAKGSDTDADQITLEIKNIASKPVEISQIEFSAPGYHAGDTCTLTIATGSEIGITPGDIKTVNIPCTFTAGAGTRVRGEIRIVSNYGGSDLKTPTRGTLTARILEE